MSHHSNMLLARTQFPAVLPIKFALRGHTSHDDPLARFSPGLEGSFRTARDAEEVAFSVHSIADGDYLGQWMYVQLARRDDATGPFGHWHYAFCYRGAGGTSWDEWHIDLFDAVRPDHAAFGAYVDSELANDHTICCAPPILPTEENTE